MRTCLDCGAIIRTGNRCPYHAAQAEARHAASKGGLYDGDWRRRSRAQRRAFPYCQDCGATDDLTADHIVPGDRQSPLRTLCRSCNSARAVHKRHPAG